MATKKKVAGAILGLLTAATIAGIIYVVIAASNPPVEPKPPPSKEP